MDIYKGVGLSPGIAHGRIHFHKRKDKDVDKAQAASAEAELRAFFASRERAEAELRRLYIAQGMKMKHRPAAWKYTIIRQRPNSLRMPTACSEKATPSW